MNAPRAGERVARAAGCLVLCLNVVFWLVLVILAAPYVLRLVAGGHYLGALALAAFVFAIGGAFAPLARSD